VGGQVARSLMEKLVEQQVTGLCDLIEITPTRLEDWDIRTIRTLLIGKAGRRERNRSFAMQKDPSEFWVTFWDRKDVTIYNLDLTEFAGQLEPRWKARQ
jgi:hypothetical protein